VSIHLPYFLVFLFRINDIECLLAGLRGGGGEIRDWGEMVGIIGLRLRIIGEVLGMLRYSINSLGMQYTMNYFENTNTNY